MPTSDSIETERLTLRAFRAADLEPLYLIQRDPQAMRYTYCAASREESERRLRAYAGLAEQVGFAPWTVIFRAHARVVGWGGLNYDPFDPGWGVEVAYFFHPDYWGRGLATELVRVSLQTGFTQHALAEIHAFAHPENGASIRVLEKCGLRYRNFEPRLNRNHYVIERADWLKTTS